MIKIIRILTLIILVSIILIILIMAFNPFALRTKIIGGIINSYLSETIPGYSPLDSSGSASGGSNDKHPLLNPDQEEKLESLGVDVEKLPQSISNEMKACFTEKLGAERTAEIVNGDTPSTLEFLKAKECISE